MISNLKNKKEPQAELSPARGSGARHGAVFRSLVRVPPRLLESIEVALHQVTAAEGVDATLILGISTRAPDQRIALQAKIRAMPPSVPLDLPALSNATCQSFFYLLNVLFSTSLSTQRLSVSYDSDNAVSIACYKPEVKPKQKPAFLLFLLPRS